MLESDRADPEVLMEVGGVLKKKRIVDSYPVRLLASLLVVTAFALYLPPLGEAQTTHTEDIEGVTFPGDPHTGKDLLDEVIADLERVVQEAENDCLRCHGPDAHGADPDLRRILNRLKELRNSKKLRVGNVVKPNGDSAEGETQRDNTVVVNSGVFISSLHEYNRLQIDCLLCHDAGLGSVIPVPLIKSILVHETVHTLQPGEERDASRDAQESCSGPGTAEVEAYYTDILVMLYQLKGLQTAPAGESEAERLLREKQAEELRGRIAAALNQVAKYEKPNNDNGIKPPLRDRIREGDLDTPEGTEGAIDKARDALKPGSELDKAKDKVLRDWEEKRREKEEKSVPPGGGSVPLPGDSSQDAGLVVPDGALAEATTIEIWRFSEPPAPDPSLDPAGQAYEFQPDTAFSEPAIITLPYEEGTDPDNVDVYVYNPISYLGEDGPLWEKVTEGRSVDTFDRTISVRIDHFSLYMPMSSSTPGAVPVPASSTWALFAFGAIGLAMIRHPRGRCYTN
ncbi:MAG: hypothetical protein ACYC1U_00210 [Candidatus Aquicultorales bacterium]